MIVLHVVFMKDVVSGKQDVVDQVILKVFVLVELMNGINAEHVINQFILCKL
jgi:hypothetical protein